jgi:peptidoglycan hydrolase-like protein with peptidoglycan-binding domain
MTGYKHYFGQTITTDAGDTVVDRAFLAHLQVLAADATAASTTGVHAAVTSTASPSVVTTGITNPSIPRCLTATAGGTATDIKAIQVVVEGTNYADEVITETLPAFTVDTAGTVQGSKAFKTVTKITIPAHDGTGATTAIGFNEKLGLPYKLAHNTVLAAYLDNAKEGTAPTVTVSATVLESNTIDLNTALSSKVVDAYLMV